MRVAPFGHLRIIAHLQLPAAFRSLSRPSSAPGAKASALRPNSLDQLLFDLYGSRLLFSLELVVFPTVMRSLPHVPRSFPGAIIFRYLCDNASIRFPILRVHRILSNLIHSARLSYMRFSRCVSRSILLFRPRFHALPFMLHRTFLFILAATCSPAPSPVKYHRPYGS